MKLCIFDMGGVLIRNFHIAPKLLPFLGLKTSTLQEYDPRLGTALTLHSEGKISEEEFWKYYREITHREVPHIQGSLLGKFFTPTLDDPTVALVKRLKEKNLRVVCGTNVIDAHFKIHHQLHQYDIFDAVYPSHILGIAKPKLEFFQRICEAEQVHPEKAFFTDDMQANVDASLKAGLKGFRYVDAKTLESQLKGLNLL
ncbi:putative HAD superfamily hydrolase [Sphaerochaeta pleomorpha str. Grapes]|uniref:Putative HAD superfamily hydrolase n=1 Tax=Sphaerochaeta pleomorpha (strain ATCC BAA-1885 / DSM 22778 / Grapes) TaxID=158190 RepID=G8QRB6_SPHPG|nr:HAD family hydrolase [Sphaerochaeta pleomorpha]AEV28769.1 putative HAD superfamily hydrolase [Sphaerochaeta pleomorpha str. Grapes]